MPSRTESQLRHLPPRVPGLLLQALHELTWFSGWLRDCVPDVRAAENRVSESYTAFCFAAWKTGNVRGWRHSTAVLELMRLVIQVPGADGYSFLGQQHRLKVPWATLSSFCHLAKDMVGAGSFLVLPVTEYCLAPCCWCRCCQLLLKKGMNFKDEQC